jgi:hypothetical protein
MGKQHLLSKKITIEVLKNVVDKVQKVGDRQLLCFTLALNGKAMKEWLGV